MAAVCHSPDASGGEPTCRCSRPFDKDYHQGAIDVTEFVEGKREVRLEFRLCADKDVPEIPIDYGVDHVQTIGLGLDNGEFEHGGGWHLEPAGPIGVRLDRQGPPVPLG